MGLRAHGTARVPADSLAFFRALFGLLMAVAVGRYFANGWIGRYFEEPAFFFTYEGFGWVRPLPAPFMNVYYAAMGALALLFACGIAFRWTVWGFGALFTYAHLIDKTLYLNHYYLISLLCGILGLLPLGRGARAAPAWGLLLLRFQVGAVYVFAGLAKLDGDWLLRAQPLSIWLRDAGPVLDRPETAYVFSWAGALFDLCVPFLMLWPRTRLPAFAAAVVFHSLTAVLFPIGLFPWVMVAAATVFLPPAWPRRGRVEPLPPSPPLHPLARAAIALFVAVQVLVPLRHLAYRGDELWREDAFRWSWKVMLVEKWGTAAFRVRHPETGEETEVDPADSLTRRQVHMMSTQPDMIRQFATHLADGRDVEVYADVFVSLNGRPSERLIDPEADLATVGPSCGRRSWVLDRR